MIKGKGAQYNPSNPFAKNELTIAHDEGIDEYTEQERPKIRVFSETPKEAISKNSSPDLKFDYSVNPYQGCEHGCIYCYARNSHTYWGFSAGLDFESNIIVKEQIAERLEATFLSSSYKPQVIMLSGNTDCYQPLEKKYKLTRKILEVCLKYRNPVSLITKNAFVLRDLDILEQMAKLSLVHVNFSITSLDEKLRAVLEPRTASYAKKLNAIAQLTERGIPVGVMNAPIIPGLNHHEIPQVLKAVSEAGALTASYTVLRLNGQVAELFDNWLTHTFPERAEKIRNHIKAMHGGKVNDTEWGRRIKGNGQHADIIRQLFMHSRNKYLKGREMPPLKVASFRKGGNYSLF